MSRSLAVVVDANLAIHTVLDTELSPLVARAWLALQKAGLRACAPRLWLYEVTSALHRAYMHGLVDEEQALAALDTALKLGVELVSDDGLSREAFMWATRLGWLATYDCFYLALAEHLAAEFWTADRALAHASRQAGLSQVHWVGDMEPG